MAKYIDITTGVLNERYSQLTIENLIPYSEVIISVQDKKHFKFTPDSSEINISVSSEFLDRLCNITVYADGKINEIKQFIMCEDCNVIMGESSYLLQGKYKVYNLEWNSNIKWN